MDRVTMFIAFIALYLSMVALFVPVWWRPSRKRDLIQGKAAAP
ncbi:hypothetical protein [Nocardia sp. NPDC127526]